MVGGQGALCEAFSAEDYKSDPVIGTAALSLFGLRSSASMLADMSIDIMISIPSVVIFCPLELDCGLARANMINAIAIILRRKGRKSKR